MSKRTGLTAALAAAAAMLAPGMMVGDASTTEVRAIHGEQNPGRPTAPLSLFREPEFDEEAFRRAILGIGRRYKLPPHMTLPKHRRPGERAHRRWRFARASGRKGAYRG